MTTLQEIKSLTKMNLKANLWIDYAIISCNKDKLSYRNKNYTNEKNLTTVSKTVMKIEKIKS